jgi:hypothetical protein
VKRYDWFDAAAAARQVALTRSEHQKLDSLELDVARGRLTIELALKEALVVGSYAMFVHLNPGPAEEFEP